MATTRAPERAVPLLSSVPRLAGRRALPSPAHRRSALVRLAVVGAVAGVAVAWAVASSTVLVNPVASGILRGAVVASCVAVGAYLAHRRPESRFGLLLAANGLLFGLTALNASSNPAVFTLGRIVNIVLWFSLAYLFLAFPGDTIRSARERSLLITLGAASVVAWVATLAVSDELPAGGQFLNCVATCPPNGLQVATVSSAVASALRLTASMLAVALLAGTAGILASRMRAGGPLQRRVFAAPLATMTLIAGAAAIGTTLRASGVSDDVVYRFSAIGRIGALLLPFGFLAGLVLGRVFVSETTNRLITELSTGSHSPARARDLLARALEQPSLRFAFWLPERSEYVDTAGVALPQSLELPGRSVTAIQRAGQPSLRECTVGASGGARRRRDRGLQLDPRAGEHASGGSPCAPRSTICAPRGRESWPSPTASAGAVERDLHDGAQHRLIALRVKLRLLEEADEADAETRARLVHELEADAEGALEDLRALVRGIYPPLLVDRGLRDALAWTIRSAPIETRLDVEGLRRYAPEVEAAVYFCCLEALQNAAKHAGSTARATIRVREVDGDLVFDVSDDGAGFGPPTRAVRRADEHARPRRRRGRHARRDQ